MRGSGFILRNFRLVINSMLKDHVFFKNLFSIAVPIIIQYFISTSLNMVDTVMIGYMGETQIAAVGIANQVFNLYTIFLFGICSGCSIFISQFWGKKDLDNIKHVVEVMLSSTLVISILFTIAARIFPETIIGIFNSEQGILLYGSKYLKLVSLSYAFTAVTFCFSFSLRCIEKAAYPMVISTVALLSNTFLNYVFIFGHFGFKAMGVEGAALATIFARFIELILIVAVVYKKNNILIPDFRSLFNIDADFFKRIYETTIPVLLNEVCWGVANTIYTVAYGRIGKEAIASIQISSTIHQLFGIFCFGMANASAVMIGKRIGAGKECEGRDYAFRFAALSIFIGILVGLMIVASSPLILLLFKVSERVLRDSYAVLKIISLVMPLRIFNIVMIVGVLRGGGDTKRAFLIEASTMWFIGVPLAFIGSLVFKLPIYGVVALTTLEEIGKFVLCAQRLTSGKWIKNLVKSF